MKQFDLGKYRKARVWLSELSDAEYSAGATQETIISVTEQASGGKQAAIEVFVPLRPRSMYGLLGGRYTPSPSGQLKVLINTGITKGKTLFPSLANSMDQVTIDLPDEYCAAVKEGIRLAQNETRIAAGELVINHAAYGEIGSCAAIFKRLAPEPAGDQLIKIELVWHSKEVEDATKPVKLFYSQNESTIDLSFTSFVDVMLDGLSLHRALLEGVDMRRSSFVGTDLRGAVLSYSDLSCAKLEKASMITAFLMHSSLRGASSRQCRAIGCQFNFEDSREADLNDADVGRACFDSARLQGARLTCLRLATASFKGAVFNAATVWPVGFDPTAPARILMPIQVINYSDRRPRAPMCRRRV